MSKEIQPTGQQVERSPAQKLAELRGLAETAAQHRERRHAKSTRSYYEADWRQFEWWCQDYGIDPLPIDPRVVALYVTDLAQQIRPDGEFRYKATSLSRHVSSIAHKNFEEGGGRGLGEHEAISDVLAGIRRLRSERRDAKHPLLLNDVKKLISDMDHSRWPAGVSATRDTLVLLLGFATAMRRSELAMLSLGQITLHPLDGLHIQLGASKTDQEGKGVKLAVPFSTEKDGTLRKSAFTCVPCAWVRWLRFLAAANRTQAMQLVYETPSDPREWQHICKGRVPEVDPELALFRAINKIGEIGEKPVTGTTISAIVKRRALASGYNPDELGGHSLRAGMVTQARRNGADHRAVRKVTRHTTDAMIDTYDRDWNPLEGSAVTMLGL